MNTSIFLGEFERICDAPDSIPKLQRFIVDLAIRGRLVQQDPNDEPASDLLRLIDAEKARLGIKERQSKRPISIAAENNPRAIPSGWAAIRAADVFPTRSGNSKLIKGRLYSEPGEDRYPGFSAAGQDVWLDSWEHDGEAVILSAVGARCGKAFLATGKWSAIANTHIVWLLPWVTHPPFAMLLLNNESFWVRSGGAQPFVKVKETLERQILIPPFAEQLRIVAKVEQLIELLARLQERANELNKLRQQFLESVFAETIYTAEE